MRELVLLVLIGALAISFGVERHHRAKLERANSHLQQDAKELEKSVAEAEHDLRMRAMGMAKQDKPDSGANPKRRPLP